jgi:hypothetical protein
VARFDSSAAQELSGVAWPTNSCSKVLLYALAAVISGICFGLQRRLLLWRRRGWEVVGDRTWKNMGRFSGWMCAGCCAGAISFAARMRAAIFISEAEEAPGISQRQRFEFQASGFRYFSVNIIFYPIQFLCIIYAMSMLLRRVSDHASHSYYNDARDQESGRRTGVKRFDCRDCVGQYRLYYLVRSMHVFAILMCALNIVARFVVAAYRVERAGLYDEAAASCNSEGKDTRSPSVKADWLSRDKASSNNREASLSASRSLEAAILVLMAGGFLLFFPACIVMFLRVERRMDAIMREMSHNRSDIGTVFLPCEFSPPAADGARIQEEMPIVEARSFLGRMKSAAAAQRRSFLLCLVLVFLGLTVHASHALFVNIVFSEPRNPDCGVCEPCQRIERLMAEWHEVTFEVFPLVSSLCSTLPLMFSLWLMMTKEDRALMLNPGRFRTDAILLQPVEDRTTASLKSHSVRMGIELR